MADLIDSEVELCTDPTPIVADKNLVAETVTVTGESLSGRIASDTVVWAE
jgi:hypothetical protein